MATNDRVLPNFQRASVPMMVLWMFLTLGLFAPWWLYRQSRVVNAHCKTFKIPELLVHAGMISLVVYTLLIVLHVVRNAGQVPLPPAPVSLQIAAVAAQLLMIAWTLFVRQGINLLSGAKLNDQHWLSLPFVIFAMFIGLFSLPAAPLYMQFKINSILQARRAT